MFQPFVAFLCAVMADGPFDDFSASPWPCRLCPQVFWATCTRDADASSRLSCLEATDTTQVEAVQSWPRHAQTKKLQIALLQLKAVI